MGEEDEALLEIERARQLRRRLGLDSATKPRTTPRSRHTEAALVKEVASARSSQRKMRRELQALSESLGKTIPLQIDPVEPPHPPSDIARRLAQSEEHNTSLSLQIQLQKADIDAANNKIEMLTSKTLAATHHAAQLEEEVVQMRARLKMQQDVTEVEERMSRKLAKVKFQYQRVESERARLSGIVQKLKERVARQDSEISRLRAGVLEEDDDEEDEEFRAISDKVLKQVQGLTPKRRDEDVIIVEDEPVQDVIIVEDEPVQDVIIVEDEPANEEVIIVEEEEVEDSFDNALLMPIDESIREE